MVRLNIVIQVTAGGNWKDW